LPCERMLAHGDFFAPQPAAGIFHDRESLRQDFIDAASEFFLVLDFRKLLFPSDRFLPQSVIRDFLQLGFQGINLRDERTEAFDLALIFRADELFYDKANHGYTLKTARRYGISGKPSKTFNNTPGTSKFKGGAG